jgi:hypothetical protein
VSDERAFPAVVALFALCSPLHAQSVPGYSASQLACSRFHESVRSDLTLQTAGRGGTATSGRESHLLVAAMARPAGPEIHLIAWFDSLRVWRSVGGNRQEPDASGVLGGRYHAQLLPDGSTTTQVVPFVPAAVKEVTDLAGVMDDMFPRLPPRVLQAGEEWRSGDTLAIKRLSDSASLQRYHVQLTLEGPVPPPPGDSLTPPYVRTLNDRGVSAWDPVRGPVRYEHEVTVEATVPAGGPIRNAARTRVEQKVLLEREPDPPAGTCPASLFAEP